MNHMTSQRRQRGATLIVGLIMLVLITLMMLTAFMMSSTNLKSVGNMQSRDEATAAANVAIEQVIGLDFHSLTAAQPYEVDIDRNPNTAPYQVIVTVERCKRSTAAPSSEAELSGVSSNIANTSDFDTVWELKAVVSDASTGASVTVLQGVRKRLNSVSDSVALTKCN